MTAEDNLEEKPRRQRTKDERPPVRQPTAHEATPVAAQDVTLVWKGIITDVRERKNAYGESYKPCVYTLAASNADGDCVFLTTDPAIYSAAEATLGVDIDIYWTGTPERRRAVRIAPVMQGEVDQRRHG